MTLTNQQIQLVTESFNKVVPIADQAAAMFYERLWEIAPETKRLFKATNMKQQGEKLMEMIGIAVRALNNLEAIIPAVQALGRRHIAYGVTEADYEPVGAALLWTLEQGLGADFTPDVKAAWTQVYSILVSVATQGYGELEGAAD